MNNVVKNSKTSPKKSVTAKQLAKSNLTKRKNPNWDNLDKGYRYLTLDMKLPHDLAVAVMGNVVEESRGDYKAVLKNGGRRGLIQWDGKNVPSGRYNLWGSIWASVAKPANVYDSTTDTVKNYWAPWGGLKGDKVRLKFIKAPIKEKARIYAESYIRSGKNSRIADRQLSAMQLDSIYNPRIKDIIVLKNGGQIRKMLTAAGGPLNLSPEDIKRGANLIGEYFLKGLGAFGKIATAPFRSQGPTSATIYKSKKLLAKERTIENKSEELLGKAMTWVSPLNYGVALATGNGLNARKGEEEVASWSPAWLALGRAAELYAGPKAVKGVKSAPRVVVNTAAKAGVKPAKVAVVAREINKGIKEIPNSDIVDNIGKKWFTDEVTFKSPFRVKEHIGQTVGDVIDFNLGLYGGSKATLASLTPNQRYSLAKLLWLTDERPVMSKLIHMEDSGTLPISRTGFVPKDASNSNSVWNSSLGSNAPEIWYLEGTPYYSAYGYPNISNIPRTIITDRQSLNNIGINLKGNKVIRHEGEIPFNLIELGIQYNPITGFFDKIKFDSGTKSSKTSSTIQISPEELYKVLKDQELNGYYFMGHGTGRTRVNPQTIFDNGLRIKGGDISNTTIPISESNLTSWPHMNSEEIIIMPGKATMTKYDSAHGHIPSDWYSSDVFHWTDNPKKVGSGPFADFEPNASFTEQTIGGVPGVYTKPEAVLGSYNTRTHTLKLNPRSLYEFLFNVPKLTEPLTSLKFFERRPAKISEAERAGVPKGERNVKQGYLLKDAIEEANKFAEKWGYDKLSQNATLLDIENLYNQHNTFFRGVTTEQLENTRNRVAKELGINPELLTNDLYLLYVSTHPWPGNDRIWVTPFSHYGKIYGNSDMIGGKGLLSAVMRPWKTTKDIKQWPKLSLWTLGFKEDVSNPVITPWVSNAPDAIRSLGSLSEFLVKSPLIYRGLGKDFKGTLLLQLKYNDGQGKLGWIESLVGELPLEIIIEKQGGKMNILEFLKNGSGIHIKEENKGKFTSYCGGKVTNECILKGKNSSNPAIRKRATFADNARHFKHEKGGELIKKAQLGTQLPKAEDAAQRYKNGEFIKEFLDNNEGHAVILGVRTNKPFHNQGSIVRKINYRMGIPVDTTYIETPPSLLPVKKVSRMATRYSNLKDNAYVGNLRQLYETLSNRYKKAMEVMRRKNGGILKAQYGAPLNISSEDVLGGLRFLNNGLNKVLGVLNTPVAGSAPTIAYLPNGLLIEIPGILGGAPEYLPGRLGRIPQLKNRAWLEKSNPIVDEGSLQAAKDWVQMLKELRGRIVKSGRPKGSKNVPKEAPVEPPVQKIETSYAQSGTSQERFLENKKMGISKRGRVSSNDKNARAMEASDARITNAGNSNLKKAQLQQVERNLNKYPKFEVERFQNKTLLNMYRKGRSEEDIRKATREFYKYLAKKYGYFKKGGKAFINGVNVLDSNPKAYKQVKKKYKMLYGGYIPEIINASPVVQLHYLWLLANLDYIKLKEDLKLEEELIELQKKNKRLDTISRIGSALINNIPGIISGVKDFTKKNAPTTNNTSNLNLNWNGTWSYKSPLFGSTKNSNILLNSPIFNPDFIQTNFNLSIFK